MKKVRTGDGFTLVEALVAVVILVVLAGVSVPLFLGQQGKAKVAVARQDGGQWATEISTTLLEVQSFGTFATAANNAMSASAPSAAGTITITIPLGDAGTWRPATVASPRTVTVNVTSKSVFVKGSVRPSNTGWCFVVNHDASGNVVYNQSGYQPTATNCVAGVVS